MSNPTGDALAESNAEQQRQIAARAALLARIESDFTYHKPKGDQGDRCMLIRQKALGFARTLVENCPPSRELSTALTNLETAVFNANAAIARNE